MYSNSLIKLFGVLITLTFAAYGNNNNNKVQDISLEFGETTYVFDTTMDQTNVQSLIDSVFDLMGDRDAHFSDKRFAFMFKPGTYELDIRVGYFTHVIGLGQHPSDVVIKGAVRANSFFSEGSVLINFWRSCENLTIEPANDDSTNTWGVSQAAPMRRVHVKGNLKVHDDHYASGGFIADCKVDGYIDAGGGQQWYTRNSNIGGWKGGSWNVFFQGVNGALEENWPDGPVTTIANTPIVREKPYLVCKDDVYKVCVPGVKRDYKGISWSDDEDINTFLLSDFYIARSGSDSAATINKALRKNKNIFFTPGIYELEDSIYITNPNTVVLGVGLATLLPVNGNKAIVIDDVEGVVVAGLMIDANLPKSDVLVEVGREVNNKDHSNNPIFLIDVFVRVGGPFAGKVQSCVVLNSNDVVIDHAWLWRADHGKGVGWDINVAANGLVVNGDNVTAYGLFCEHYHEYQTLWKGENGKVYFFQCEMPYDPPAPESWTHNGTNGFAAYKVTDSVKVHHAWGLGIYNVFKDAAIIVDQAIECPPHLEDNFNHVVTFFLSGHPESEVKSIINGKGAGVNIDNRKGIW